MVCYNSSNTERDERDESMKNIDKSEKLTIAAYIIIPFGLFMFADAPVLLRCYGDQVGAMNEFVLGVIAVVVATILLYIAGMLRDRRIQAEFARRRAEREHRRAERENRSR